MDPEVVGIIYGRFVMTSKNAHLYDVLWSSLRRVAQICVATYAWTTPLFVDSNGLRASQWLTVLPIKHDLPIEMGRDGERAYCRDSTCRLASSTNPSGAGGSSQRHVYS